jgi:ACS family tartrate transporter-like MFS transporter
MSRGRCAEAQQAGFAQAVAPPAEPGKPRFELDIWQNETLIASLRRRDFVAVASSARVVRALAPAWDHTRRRVGARLLPFLFVLYIVNYLDRTSVAYAALGMSRDLGFTDHVLGMGMGIFFISYVILQIPGALLVERWSARKMISGTMIAWGLLTALTATVHTPGQLYLARFVLGAAEAGFFPGVIVYLSHWFVLRDRAKATSNFMGAIPLSFVIGSPIAGWILGRQWFQVEGWRWLFVVEGMPAVLLGVVAFFALTDRPGEATWLAPDERQWIERKLDEERQHGPEEVTVWQALRSRTTLLLSGLTFLCYFAFYSFAFWFPTMLKRQSGLSDLWVGLLGSVPYLLAFLTMQVSGWHSDKHLERRWHSAVPLFCGAAGLLGLIRQPGSLPWLMVFFSLAGLLFAYLPTFWAIPTALLSRSAAAAAVGMINAFGSMAGFAGPHLFGYLNTRTGTFSYGLATMMGSALAGGLLILSLPRTARTCDGPPVARQS